MSKYSESEVVEGLREIVRMRDHWLSSYERELARALKAERERDAAVVALKLAADRLEGWENDRCQHYGSCYCHSESTEARRLLESLSSAGKGAAPRNKKERA